MIYFGFWILLFKKKSIRFNCLTISYHLSVCLSIYIILINVTLFVSYFFLPLCVSLSPSKYPFYIHVFVL